MDTLHVKVIALFVGKKLLAMGAMVLLDSEMNCFFVELSRLPGCQNSSTMSTGKVTFENLTLTMDGIHVVLQAAVLSKRLATQDAHKVSVPFMDGPETENINEIWLDIL